MQDRLVVTKKGRKVNNLSYPLAVSDDLTNHVDLLSATSFDVRARIKAQGRSLMLLQRCVEDYRQTMDPRALTEVAIHAADVERHAREVLDALAFASDAMTALNQEVS